MDSYPRSDSFDTFLTVTCNRMRNATILVVGLKGVATEVIKNIVLAGVGKIVILDDKEVDGEDLGAGFFFTDADVGKKVSKHFNGNLTCCVVDSGIRGSKLPSPGWKVSTPE